MEWVSGDDSRPTRAKTLGVSGAHPAGLKWNRADSWEYLLDPTQVYNGFVVDPIAVYNGCPRSTKGFFGADSCGIFTKPPFCLQEISLRACLLLKSAVLPQGDVDHRVGFGVRVASDLLDAIEPVG